MDDMFAFGSDPVEGGRGPLYTRGEAEHYASKILATLPALPRLVLDASEPAGPTDEALYEAAEADGELAMLSLLAGQTRFWRRSDEPILSLPELMRRVGVVAFRNITFVSFFYRLFQRELAWYGYGRGGLWLHLVATAIGAWKLGEAAGLHRLTREVVFFGAILHDIGKPTIQGILGAQAPAPEEASRNWELTLPESELRTANMTHMELVPLMLDIWGVEHSIFAVAEHHHAPQRAGQHTPQAGIVQLADLIANRAGIGFTRAYGFANAPIDRVARRANVGATVCQAVENEVMFAVNDLAEAYARAQA